MRARAMARPALSVGSFVLWLLLTGDLSAGNLALAALLGLIVPTVISSLLPDRGRLPHEPMTALRLFGVFLADMVTANLEVAWIILTRPERSIRPGFVDVPLDLRDARGILVLVAIISLTPGTLSVDLDPHRRRLLVQVLDLRDPERVVRDIKERYEAPLLRIFPRKKTS